MKKTLTLCTAVSALALLVCTGGCAGPSAQSKAAEPEAGFTKLSGKVVETTDAGGYTYICLENDGKKTWVAVPSMKVKVGDELKLMPGSEMSNFASPSLGRTFEKIVFSGGPELSAAEAAKARVPAANKAGEAKAFEKPVLAGKVVETMNAKGYTYICLEKDGKRGWSAVPVLSIKVGEEIELIPGTDMGKFTSPALNRTFDNIHFSPGVKGADGKYRTDAPQAADPEKAPLPANHPALKPQDAPATAAAPITGKVVETMDSGGYSYISLEKDGKKTWLAVPAMKVTVGDQLSFQSGMEMPSFTSKSLNRTFEKIIFSNGLAQ
jgi:predicted lipoprotein